MSLFMCLLPKNCESAKSWPCVVQCILYCYVIYCHLCRQQGRIQGGVHLVRAPSKIWKNMIFFGVKSWFFTRNTPTFFAPPSARPNFLKFTPPPNLKSWIRPWTIYVFAEKHQKCSPKTLIGSVIVSVFASSAVDRGLSTDRVKPCSVHIFCHLPHSVGNLWFRVLFLQNPYKKLSSRVCK